MGKYGLSKEKLEAEIASVDYVQFNPTGLLCTITLCNGYTVTGESSCIDPTTFNVEIGKNIAYTKAFEKLWGVLGYVEKTRWWKETQLTWLDRLHEELAELDIKIKKLSEKFEGPVQPSTDKQQELLTQQLKAMRAYALILQERIVQAK